MMTVNCKVISNRGAWDDAWDDEHKRTARNGNNGQFFFVLVRALKSHALDVRRKHVHTLPHLTWHFSC